MLEIEEVKKTIKEATEYSLSVISKVFPYNKMVLKETKYCTPQESQRDGVIAIFENKTNVPLFEVTLTDEHCKICFSPNVKKAIFELAMAKPNVKNAKKTA